jgi:hypothetical protein
MILPSLWLLPERSDKCSPFFISSAQTPFWLGLMKKSPLHWSSNLFQTVLRYSQKARFTPIFLFARLTKSKSHNGIFSQYVQKNSENFISRKQVSLFTKMFKRYFCVNPNGNPFKKGIPFLAETLKRPSTTLVQIKKGSWIAACKKKIICMQLSHALSPCSEVYPLAFKKLVKAAK